MKIILMISDSISNRYLVKKIRENFDLIGIVIQEEIPEGLISKIAKIGSPVGIIKHMFLRLLTMASYRQGRRLEKEYFSNNGLPYVLPEDAPIIKVKNINDPQVRDFIFKFKPDLLAVSGTQLLRQPILSLYPAVIKKGIVNMHTGLSPYIRGGNATFWALYSGKPQYIGATIHYIDADIDKGDIILSGRPDNIEFDDTDFTIDVKVRKLGIGLYIKALKQIQEGTNKRVKQWPGGRLFAVKTGHKKDLHMIYELRKRLKKEKILKKYLADKQECDKDVVIID